MLWDTKGQFLSKPFYSKCAQNQKLTFGDSTSEQRIKIFSWNQSHTDFLCGQSSSLISLTILKLFKIDNWPTLEFFSWPLRETSAEDMVPINMGTYWKPMRSWTQKCCCLQAGGSRSEPRCFRIVNFQFNNSFTFEYVIMSPYHWWMFINRST